ncbi:MAG TPA: DUF5667 domain-containing protein [Micromonosporaceae bacterium]
MTPLSDRRRAERFAQLVDAADGGRHRHSRSPLDEDLGDLVAISRRVSALPIDARPDDEFRTSLRAMLVAAVERDGVGSTEAPVPAAPPRSGAALRPVTPQRTRTRAAIVVGLAAGAIALSGMSAASGGAIPGDALYTVKRSTEKAHLAITSSQVTRGQLYLEFARTRLGEARAVRDNPAGLAAVLGDMDDETSLGTRLLTQAAEDRRDATPLDVVDRFVAEQRDDVNRLLTGLAGESRSRVLTSLGLLTAIQQRTAALRPTLACTTPDRGVDDLGPIPGSCTGPVPGATPGSSTGHR